jgi:hypothetical protein
MPLPHSDSVKFYGAHDKDCRDDSRPSKRFSDIDEIKSLKGP